MNFPFKCNTFRLQKRKAIEAALPQVKVNFTSTVTIQSSARPSLFLDNLIYQCKKGYAVVTPHEPYRLFLPTSSERLVIQILYHFPAHQAFFNDSIF